MNDSTCGNTRQDGSFGSGIMTLHIGCWIALGVAQLLGLRQGTFIGDSLFCHLREDVVGGAVDNAHNGVDCFACQRHLKGADERNTTGYSCFKIQAHSSSGGCG